MMLSAVLTLNIPLNSVGAHSRAHSSHKMQSFEDRQGFDPRATQKAQS